MSRAKIGLDSQGFVDLGGGPPHGGQMIYVAGLGAPVPSEMNNSNYESNKIVLNSQGLRALGEGPPHGGHKILDARPAAQGPGKTNNSNYESNKMC